MTEITWYVIAELDSMASPSSISHPVAIASCAGFMKPP
jgi:hypothetical protein